MLIYNHIRSDLDVRMSSTFGSRRPDGSDVSSVEYMIRDSISGLRFTVTGKDRELAMNIVRAALEDNDMMQDIAYYCIEHYGVQEPKTPHNRGARYRGIARYKGSGKQADRRR